ncbi:MAG: hypothetical protein U1E83_01345 [Methylotetracoccus sp.]
MATPIPFDEWLRCDSAADDDRQTAEMWISKELHGRVEGIHVEMGDSPFLCSRLTGCRYAWHSSMSGEALQCMSASINATSDP